MRKITLFVLSLVLLLGVCSGLFGQTLLWTQDFASTAPTGWTVVNAGSGNNWSLTATGDPYSGTYHMRYQWNSSYAANTWAFTPGIAMTAGRDYYLTFWQKVEGASFPENLKVTVGNAQTVASQTTTVLTLASLTNTTYAQRTTAYYRPTTSGTYYFAFNCYSAANMYYLHVDYVQAYELVATGPANPTAFTATPSSSTQINLGWTRNATPDNVLLAWNTTNTFGTPSGSYTAGNTITGGGTVLLANSSATSYNHTGRDPNTTYYYKIWSQNGAGPTYSTGVTANATTQMAPITTFPWTETVETNSTSLAGWTQAAGSGSWDVFSGASAYGIGTQSFRAPFYSISGTTPFHLYSPSIDISALASPQLTFDYAYATYSGEIDQMDVYYSTDGGGSYSLLLSMPGGTAGILNTGGTVTSVFVPTSTQWATQILALPSGTNKLRFTATSAYGNQLYLDNVTVETGSTDPEMTISETSYDFGLAYNVSSNCTPHYFIAQNTGAGTVTIASAPQFTGTDASQFTLIDANTYPIELDATEFAYWGVKFTPSSYGEKTAYLSIVDDISTKGLSFFAAEEIPAATEGVKAASNATAKSVGTLPTTTVKTRATNNVSLRGFGVMGVFEDYFETYSHLSGTLNPWTQYDGDVTQTWGLQYNPGSGAVTIVPGYTGSFICLDFSSYSPEPDDSWRPYGGDQYAGCAAANGAVNNDWLISPQLSFQDSPRISFFAKSLAADYYPESFNVLYSTTGNSYTNFAGNYLNSTQPQTVGLDWTLFEYELPAACANTNVYIAIQCVSNDMFMLMIDDFVAGDYGQPQFHISPSSHVFEDFFINYTRERLFTVTNNGGGSMQVVADGISMSGDAYFKLKDLPALPITLGAGQSFSFTVYYNSPRAGSHSATLSVTDNLSKAIHTVAISGSTTDNTITQKPYMEGFEPSYEGGTEFQVQGWVRRDNNGDGYPWLLVNVPSMAKSGNWLAVSQSWAPDAKASSLRLEALEADATSSIQTKAVKTARDRLVLNPDNWLISPPITISAGDSLNYWIGAYSDTRYAEHYALLISTGDPDPSQFTTTLIEETLTTHAWQYRAFNLDAWDGQTVYFAFRHYNCTDQLALRIDDVKIKADNTEIYQDYVGDPVQGDKYFKIAMQQNIQDEMNLIPLTVEIEGWLPEASNLLVTGSVGYGQPQIYIQNAGLTVLVSGVDMGGATVRVTHNLDYLPLNLAYRSLSGNFSFVTPAQSSLWTTTQVEFLVPAAKAGEGLEIVFPDTDDSTLPVELSSFTVSITGNFQIQLLWVTQSETNLLGYQIYRGESDDFARAIRLEAFIMATNTSQQQLYAFTDTELCQSGKYYYWLEHLEMDGSSHLHGPVLAVYTLPEGSTPGVPVIPGISSIYPNPFNPDTTIRFGLKQQADYRLSIYNLRGQLVRELDSGSLPAGYHKVMWNGRDQRGTPCPSGIYLLRMSSGSQTWSGKLVLAK